MKPFELYKHIHNTDVALMPVKLMFIPQKAAYRIKCKWFNIVNPKNVFDMGCDEVVWIKREDLPNWRPYEQV